MSDTPETDVDLLRRLARGDKNALGVLYDRHASQLLGIAIRMLSHREEAEDVVHDVFVEIWKRAGDFDPSRGAVRTWIKMRLRSRCLDRLRSPKRRGQSLEEHHLGSTEMRANTDRDPLTRAMLTLPETQRSVVRLAYLEGLSGPEISESLAIPLGTVKSRMAAGLGKLRLELLP